MNYKNSEPSLLIEYLLAYALKNDIIVDSDIIYMRNLLLDFLKLVEPQNTPNDLNSLEIPEYATPILDGLIEYSCKAGYLENNLTSKDLFDTKLMGILMPKPSEIIENFVKIKSADGIKSATEYFYNICRKCDYIRVSRINENIEWIHDTLYGSLEITINLTKPEKDPSEIAALRNAVNVDYPKCLLCAENVGYAGRNNFPARQTLRTLPLTLNSESWHFQYSPYVYYPHHCIVFSNEHIPMKITELTFVRLFEFLDEFPHFFIGSNAGLPIVGGSILNHDHFQGGFHKMPMAKASLTTRFNSDIFKNVNVGIVKWPMAALRLQSNNKIELLDLCSHLLNCWELYSDNEVEIRASSILDGDSIAHNAITPIARFADNGMYEIDLVFRNNRTSAQHPLGIFHPHDNLHHIKKENIGLIEVMGLFILPGRLLSELSEIEKILISPCAQDKLKHIDKDNVLHKHYDWILHLISKYGFGLDKNIAEDILRIEVGEKCLSVLHDASVFKDSAEGQAAFVRFIESSGMKIADLGAKSLNA